jgi:hypothetical protein
MSGKPTDRFSETDHARPAGGEIHPTYLPTPPHPTPKPTDFGEYGRT